MTLAGKPTPRYASGDGVTAFNERDHNDKKEYTLSRIKREFRATHQKFSS